MRRLITCLGFLLVVAVASATAYRPAPIESNGSWSEWTFITEDSITFTTETVSVVIQFRGQGPGAWHYRIRVYPRLRYAPPPPPDPEPVLPDINPPLAV